MKAEAVFLSELIESLDEDARRIVEAVSQFWGIWDQEQDEPWGRFGSRFARLRNTPHEDVYRRLQRRFAVWLEERGDPRGELVRLRHDLDDLGEYGPRASGIEVTREDAFVLDIVEHPEDE